MNRNLALAAWLILLTSSPALGQTSSPDKTPSHRDFTDVRQEVETLRGARFLHDVPVYLISEKEMRAIADRDLEKDFPGPKLDSYAELQAWLDIVPPHTNLKAVYEDFLVDQVAGLYDTDSQEMCIPSFGDAAANSAKKAAEKKLEAISAEFDDIVFAHEFTHALEDQHWRIDAPEDHDLKASTDRGTAHDFVSEGSATRAMIEAVPAQWAHGSSTRYFLLWNLIHSGPGERALNSALSASWKSPDALTPGVPDALSRTESIPYSFGYTFCTGIQRKWGLDGLDYVCAHPPLSSSQVMHPTKYWEWRDLPMQIDLPEVLPGGWKQTSIDSVGEAGLAVLLGCQFTNLNRGLELARGWKGDHVALFENSGGHRLFLWASAWDSTNAAGRFAEGWLNERRLAHQSFVTSGGGPGFQWQSPDGRAGLIRRDHDRVLVLETDAPQTLQQAELMTRAVTFTAPADEARRAAINSPLRRFNPLWSWQKDEDYVVTRSLGGLLSRHDRNGVGAADQFVLGFLAESRRTASFRKWELGAGLIVRHESEARRGTSKTTWLPWGVLASHSSARWPQAPDKILTRTSVLWGLAAGLTTDGADNRSANLLPFGLLFHRNTQPNYSSTHVLGTGVSHQETADPTRSATRVRLLGIPIWTSHARKAHPRPAPPLK